MAARRLPFEIEDIFCSSQIQAQKRMNRSVSIWSLRLLQDKYIYLIDGRIDEDIFARTLKCDAKNTIEDATTSAELYPHDEFYRRTFDLFISEKHAPIILEIRRAERSERVLMTVI